jgi:hypothetical protein
MVCGAQGNKRYRNRYRNRQNDHDQHMNNRVFFGIDKEIKQYIPYIPWRAFGLFLHVVSPPYSVSSFNISSTVTLDSAV